MTETQKQQPEPMPPRNTSPLPTISKDGDSPASASISTLPTPPSESAMDSSSLKNGSGHIGTAGVMNGAEDDDEEEDHYENKDVKGLSRGNKEYLMLVPTDNGDLGDDDTDDGLESDDKLGDVYDGKRREDGNGNSDSGYRMDNEGHEDEISKDNLKNDVTTNVFMSAKEITSEVLPPVINDTEVIPEMRVDVAKNNHIPVRMQDNHKESEQYADTQKTSIQGEVTFSDNTQTRVVPQSMSSDTASSGFRDSVSSDVDDAGLTDSAQSHLHKVAPLPDSIGVSDSEDDQSQVTRQQAASVERRKTWGSLEFRGFFGRLTRQTGVQRRSSVAARPATPIPSTMTRSASQADILCGECDYCVSLPERHRLLQTQLDKSEKDFKKKETNLSAEIKTLKKENDRQQKLIGQSLTLGPEAKIEATMQHEITRLTGENLDLREVIDKQSDQIRKLKKMLKVYSRKLKDGEAAEIQAEIERDEKSEEGALATVKHRQRIFLGMLEYRRDDEGALLKNLILELKPKIAAGMIPGLPSYILFMCVRHTDYTNDDDKVRALLTGTINSIKKVVKKHPDDMERCTMWLANTCRILHTLKQYSGEKIFQSESTSKQTDQCLRNFDLSEYRQVFSDLAVWIYQGLLKLMQQLIQPNIVPAMLEHEAIAGLTASKPSGLRGRSMSNARELDDDESKTYSMDSLMRTLHNYMRIVTQHAVDPEMVKQIFRQLYYFICAGALNNLLLRKDMCNWSKGMQIRYNISHLEQWLRDNKLHESGASSTLETLIQASQLLQARKTDADVESVCEMCPKLTLPQIVKILNLYTPVDEFEERVPISFIRKIQERLKNRQGLANTLLMDTKYSYPVTFPFNPSSIAMETIDVPEQLHLGFVKRI